MAQVVVEMSGDEAKLYRSYQRIIDQAAKLDGKVKENKKSHDDAFGTSTLNSLASYASGVLSVTAALGAAQRAMAMVREESDRLAASQRTGGPALGQLAQLAETPAQMQSLVASAKATFASGGAKTIEQAAAMQFALESAGAGGMRADFARLQGTGLVPNAQLMAESAAKLQKAFGAAKTGDLSRIVSTAFGGGKIGLGSAEQLLAGAASAGTFAQRIGLSPEETMAAVSTLSGVLGPEGAATAAEQLFKNIEVQGIVQNKSLKRGEGLPQYLSQIQALEKKGRPISEILGNRAEAIVAYGLLTNPEGAALFPQNMANIQQAQSENWMQQKLGLAAQVPENAAAMAVQTAANRGQVVRENKGIFANLAGALAEDTETKMYERWGWSGWLAAKADNALSRTISDEGYVRESVTAASPALQASILEVLQSIDRNTRGNSGAQRAAANAQPE